MKEQIFILNNEKLIELNETEFISENQFQELLENYPNLISGNQINPANPRKWLFISREFGVPDKEKGNNKWSLDHLFVDQDGIPTLIEVKRSTDSRIRREVVGQMLDYAANAVSYWSISEIKTKFEIYCEEQGINATLKIQELIGENYSIENFWETVDTNLKAGKIRLLFVADKIPNELQRIIEFLNGQMTPAEVLGVEIKQFINNNIKTLVPRVVGRTSIAQAKKSIREYNKWTEETFFAELERTSGISVVKTAKEIISYVDNIVTRFWFGEGKILGSIIPTLDMPDASYYLFSIWTDGKIEIPFQWYKNKNGFREIAKRKEMLNMLNKINGINFKQEKIDKRPSFPIKLLNTENEFQKFTETLDWIMKNIQKP